MFDPLDPSQLNRIEAVHRGFVYQHLYGVACLLVAGSTGVRSITIEHDEDIELELDNGDHVYIQVKSRQSSLIYTDIKSTLSRFEQLRLEHHEGRRRGHPSFVIAADNGAGPKLNTLIERGDVPAYVLWRVPERWPASPTYLPPAWTDNAAAFQWCVDQARTLPMRTIQPETLVLKLAGKVILAAAGQAPGHAFETSALPRLFEQIVVQLQHFPAPPDIYRPLDNEPPLDNGARVRIISGHSGAGKTAWAAQAARHLGDTFAYYDVGYLESGAIADSLTRDLAAQWALPLHDGLTQVLRAGLSGTETLRALDGVVGQHSFNALVVLDNAHRMSANDLRMMIETTRHVRFVLLAQPTASIAAFEASFGLKQEPLQGWGPAQVAAEVHAAGAQATAADLARLLKLTGGIPLFVRNAAELSTTQYGGKVADLCAAIEAHTHVIQMAQEFVLGQSFDRLPEAVRNCVAILSFCDVPLRDTEAASVARAAFDLDEAAFASAMRRLGPLGIVRYNGVRQLQIHDAFRTLGRRRLTESPSAHVAAGLSTLKGLLEASFVTDRDASRFALFIRTLIELRDLDSLLELVTEEFFLERGIDGSIWVFLQTVASDDTAAPMHRFEALDALVSAGFKSADLTQVGPRLALMELLVERHHLGEHAQQRLWLKRMVFDAEMGDEAATLATIERAQSLASRTPDIQRILRYGIAHALFRLGRYEEAQAIAFQLVKEYHGVLGLSRDDAECASPARISGRLVHNDTLLDDLKHLADVYDLIAKAWNRRGYMPGAERAHAITFYALSQSWDSLVNVGQDFVDELIARNQAAVAKAFMEQQLLPTIDENAMHDKLVEVRSLYAVVLAYCGLHSEAAAQMAQLDAYMPGLTEARREELLNQRALITRLRPAPIR